MDHFPLKETDPKVAQIALEKIPIEQPIAKNHQKNINRTRNDKQKVKTVFLTIIRIE